MKFDKAEMVEVFANVSNTAGGVTQCLSCKTYYFCFLSAYWHLLFFYTVFIWLNGTP